MTKMTRESEPFGKGHHVLIEVTDPKFTVCIDITGTEEQSTAIADSLQKCLKTILKKAKPNEVQ